MERAVDASEWMDADDLDPATYAAVLADLARVNTLTLARRPTLAFLDALLPQKRLRILDVGYGDGDMLRAVHDWGRRRGVAVDLVGIDLNPKSAATARASTPADMTIDWRTGDYIDLAGQNWHVVLSSLVAHHMTHGELVLFVRFMEAEARVGWFVNDLERSAVAQTLFRIGAGALRLHPVVRHDGALSVARSYRAAEWAPILAAAEVTEARVRRIFPWRLCVDRRR